MGLWNHLSGRLKSSNFIVTISHLYTTKNWRKKIIFRYLENGNNSKEKKEKTNYKTVIENMLKPLQEFMLYMFFNILFKVHCFHCHLVYFPKTLSKVSYDNKLKDLREYKLKWIKTNMLSESCWIRKRDYPCNVHFRISDKRRF